MFINLLNNCLGRTGLFYAVKRGQIEIAKLLLATDRKLIEHKDNWGKILF